MAEKELIIALEKALGLITNKCNNINNKMRIRKPKNRKVKNEYKEVI